MQQKCTIDLALLPEEGKNFTGELVESVFELDREGERAMSPLKYELWVQRFESELLLQGHLEAAFELTCVRCLRQFVQTVALDGVAISIDLEEGEGNLVDITEPLREEVLLELPTDPHCEEGDEQFDCVIDSRYLAVDKEENSDIETPPGAQQGGQWAALDTLEKSDLSK